MTGRWSTALITERLLLTPIAPADAEVLLAMFREPMVRRYLLDDEPIERPWVDHEIAVSAERFADDQLGLWIGRDQSSGDVVGFVGFRPFYEPPVVQLVYGLNTRATGVGLATEMAEAVIDLAFSDPTRTEILASADQPNQSSLRVLERLGFIQTGLDRGPRWSHLHFVRTRR